MTTIVILYHEKGYGISIAWEYRGLNITPEEAIEAMTVADTEDENERKTVLEARLRSFREGDPDWKVLTVPDDGSGVTIS